MDNILLLFILCVVWLCIKSTNRNQINEYFDNNNNLPFDDQYIESVGCYNENVYRMTEDADNYGFNNHKDTTQKDVISVLDECIGKSELKPV